MKKISIELKWAIVYSAMGLLWMVLEKLSGLHDKYIDYHMYLTGIFILPAIVVIVYSLKDKKNSYYSGIMSYRQGLISGIILSVMIAAISPMTQWITSYIISPEFFPNAIKRSVEIGYYTSTEMAEANFNYKNYAIQGAIGSLIMVIVISAIAMLFLKSKTKI